MTGKVNEKIGYVLGTGSGGGTTRALDTYVTYDFTDELTLRVGQYNLAYTREQAVSSSRQVAVERSVAHSFFAGGRSQGAELKWQNDEFRINGTISDGFRALNTSTTSAAD